jgi:acyl dehydratase
MRLFVDGRDDDTASAGGRGVDDLRWHKPVRPGDVLSVRAETVEKRPSSNLPSIGQVDHALTELDQDGEPVITWTALALVERREADRA